MTVAEARYVEPVTGHPSVLPARCDSRGAIYTAKSNSDYNRILNTISSVNLQVQSFIPFPPVGQTILIENIYVGYSAVPTNGSVSIWDFLLGVLFIMPITTAGITVIPVNALITPGVGAGTVVFIPAGGAGITGSISVTYRYVPV